MIVVLILAAAAAFLLLYGVSIYNKLVRLKNLVKEAWSSIDVMLKKRHDLIPNLVETVKGYAAHEKETLQSVIDARNQAAGGGSVKETEAAETRLTSSLTRLFALAEQYPDLKANTNFLQLQDQLAAIEGDIEKSRRYYNGTVRNYNTVIESFPSNVVSGMFNFEKEAYFELSNPEERNVPQVKF
ncbi:MAG: LemA family protein [Leadbetterella sp.]|nr:LemA family protein [Leadbetterella sp.]